MGDTKVHRTGRTHTRRQDTTPKLSHSTGWGLGSVSRAPFLGLSCLVHCCWLVVCVLLLQALFVPPALVVYARCVLPVPASRIFFPPPPPSFPFALCVSCWPLYHCLAMPLRGSVRTARRRVWCARLRIWSTWWGRRLAPGCVPWLWAVACLSCDPLGPTFVRLASSGPVSLGAPFGFPVAVVPSPTKGSPPPFFVGGSAGHVDDHQELDAWCWALPPPPPDPAAVTCKCG